MLLARLPGWRMPFLGQMVFQQEPRRQKLSQSGIARQARVTSEPGLKFMSNFWHNS